MADHKTVQPESQDIERAQTMWVHFAEWTKWIVIATCAILVLLAITLL